MVNRANKIKYLKGYWGLNYTADDLILGNNGTWIGTEAYELNSHRRFCGKFNGNSVVNLGNPSYMQFGETGHFTVNIYMNTNNGGFYLWSKRDGSNGGYSLYLSSSGELIFYKGSYAAISTSQYVDDGIDHMITIVFDGSMYLYIDGELKMRRTTISGTFSDSTDWIIGGRGNGSGGYLYMFNGRLGQMSIYNIALSADEVKSLLYKQACINCNYGYPLPMKNPYYKDSLVLATGFDTGKPLSDATGKSFTFTDHGIGVGEYSNFMGDGSSGSYVEIASDSSLQLIDKGSIVGWIKLNSGALGQDKGAVIAGQRCHSNPAVALAYSIGLYQGGPTPEVFKPRITFSSGYSSNIITGNKIFYPGEWTLVGMTWDGNDYKIYVNGELDVSGTKSITIAYPNNAPFNIAYGKNATITKYLDGEIRNVMVYNDVLSADEIKMLYRSSVPDDDMLLYVTNGDKDLSRYGHTLINNGVTIGYGMAFDGSSYLTLPDMDDLLKSLTEFTAEFCIYTNTVSGGAKGILGLGDYYNRQIWIYTYADNIYFNCELDGANKIVLSRKLESGTFYYVACVWDGSKIKVYVNGVLDNESDAVGSLPSSSNKYYIGYIDTIAGIDSHLNYIKVWSKAKSFDEIKFNWEKLKHKL